MKIIIFFKKIFYFCIYNDKCKNKYRFDVIDAFERIHQLFPQVTTEVVEDNSTDVITDLSVPAACNKDIKGYFHIAVRERIYEGACNGVGGYRGHIMHEICHAILCLFGFVPVLQRSFGNNKIEPRYISMEWQAKALAGEVMVPYEETTISSDSPLFNPSQGIPNALY